MSNILHFNTEAEIAQWRALDARRIVETYIQCSSASPLSLKDQHDDNSSVSSRSSMSSTRSSGSSRSSPSPSRTQSRTTSRTQPVPLRKSSAASGGPTPPGSYPTLFGADKKGSGRVSSSAQTIKSGTSIARGGSSSTLTSPASSSSSLWSSLSDLRQSLKTLRTFLAVRQYTKLQVVMVSIVCLLVGLLLPFERLFVMVGTEPNLIRPSAGVVTAAAAAPIRSGVDKSDTNNAAVLKFVDRRKNVVAITNKAVMEALRDPAAAVVLVDPKSKPSGDTRQPDPEGSV
ncbi:hypothetical protein DFQ27_004940 [Actinomortierella ambigua]|uniref:Uncharacterized protein n=1 Tax=Actinomortierella ambigua TaxID=1343610 RepID=A0A9P6U3A3_9FUNG|nr:hypothetical protein DFQ27_004940 [Actinomortierella ambigua]